MTRSRRCSSARSPSRPSCPRAAGPPRAPPPPARAPRPWPPPPPPPPLPGQPEGEDDPFAGRRGEVVARQVVACRQFTAQEVELLASAAGLELAAVHGEMRMDVPSLSHEDAYRMVAVMRKPVG